MDELSDEENDLLAELQSEEDVERVVASVRPLRPWMLHCYCLDIEKMDDLSPLFAALTSLHCDRGTGTLIYWMSDPNQFAGKDSVAEQDLQQFELYKKAEASLLSNSFATRKIKFDPISEMWYDKAYWQAVRRNPHIPNKLKPKIAANDLLPEWSLFRTLETVPGEKCRKSGCVDERVKLSVFCRKHHFEMIFKQPPPNIEDSELHGDNSER